MQNGTERFAGFIPSKKYYDVNGKVERGASGYRQFQRRCNNVQQGGMWVGKI